MLCKIMIMLLSELNLFWQLNFNKCCIFEPQWKTMKNNDNESELKWKVVSKFLFSPSRKSIVCRYVFFLLLLDCGIKFFIWENLAPMPPKPLQRVVAVICVIQWEPRSQWARSAACVPSGGRERCVQTHGAHWRGGTQLCFFYCSQSSARRRGTSSHGSLLDGKKERENAPGRKDSRHSSFPSGVRGGGFPVVPCVRLARWKLMFLDPLSRDVVQHHLQNLTALPAAPLYIWMYWYLLALVCGNSNLSADFFFFFNISDASIWDEPLLEIIVSPPFPPPD